MIREKEAKKYIIGGEESFGLMIGNQIRDKDGVSAVTILCEMAAYRKNKAAVCSISWSTSMCSMVFIKRTW